MILFKSDFFSSDVIIVLISVSVFLVSGGSKHCPFRPSLGISTPPLYTTPITALELYRGAFLSTNPERSLAVAKKILATLIVLPLDDEAAIIFGASSARLRSEERRIGDFDEVIASIELARQGDGDGDKGRPLLGGGWARAVVPVTLVPRSRCA